MTKKILALSLSILLLGQNFAFAAAPKNLQDYQQRAKQELSGKSWLKTKGLAILGATGTAAGLFFAVYHKINSLNKQQKILEKQLRDSENLITQLQKEQKRNKNKIQGLDKARTQYRQEAAALKKEIAFMQEQQIYYIGLLDLPHAQNLGKYTNLFDKKTTDAEKKKLLKEIQLEPWYKALKAEEQKEFLQSVKIFSEQAGYPSVSEESLISMISAKSKFSRSAGSLFREFAHNLLQRRNLLTIVVIFTLGWAATADAQGQKRAERINKNFSLFINATPSQLAEMEKDPIQKQVCIQGAETLHLLSTMGEKEVNEMYQNMQKEGRKQRMTGHPAPRAR